MGHYFLDTQYTLLSDTDERLYKIVTGRTRGNIFCTPSTSVDATPGTSFN